MKKKERKAIYSTKIENGIELTLKGYDSNGREFWVLSSYHNKTNTNS